MKVTRDRLQAALISKYGNDVLINGHAEHRLPNTLNISFKGLKGKHRNAFTSKLRHAQRQSYCTSSRTKSRLVPVPRVTQIT